MPSTLPPLVRFANFEVDLRAGELRREGSKVRLQEQPFLLLTVLLESAGEVVTREELRKRLWAEDTFVDFDHRLAVAVSKLRDALRDSAEKPTFVETVGRRGYRFLGQLESADSLSADSNAGVGDTSSGFLSTSCERTQLPKRPLGCSRIYGRSRLILFSPSDSSFSLAVIALAEVCSHSIRERTVFGSPELGDPSAAKSWPRFKERLSGIITGGCTDHEIGLCEFSQRSTFCGN